MTKKDIIKKVGSHVLRENTIATKNRNSDYFYNLRLRFRNDSALIQAENALIKWGNL